MSAIPTCSHSHGQSFLHPAYFVMQEFIKSFFVFCKMWPISYNLQPTHTRIHLIVVFSSRKKGEKLKWFNFIYILCHIQIKYATPMQKSRKKNIKNYMKISSQVLKKILGKYHKYKYNKSAKFFKHTISFFVFCVYLKIYLPTKATLIINSSLAKYISINCANDKKQCHSLY